MLRVNNWFAVLAAALVVMMAACGTEQDASIQIDSQTESQPSAQTSDSANHAAPPAPAEQPPVIGDRAVELIFAGSTAASDSEFMRLHGDFIVKKYPNVTFHLKPNRDTPLAERIAIKEDMDIIIIGDATLYQLIDLEVALDLTELAEKHNFDLSVFEPTALDLIRNVSGGKLTALPYRVNAFVMFYNKDLFDKFGVPYPENGMTWDETYEAAKLLTRFEDGVQYYGLGGARNQHFLLQNQLSLELVDPDTKKAAFENDGWRKFFDHFTRFYQLPGYAKDGVLPKDADMFQKEKRMAMYLDINGQYTQHLNSGVNFDIVQLPSFADFPGVGSQPSVSLYVLSVNSKQKDEAFVALMELLSEETQLEKAKGGSGSPLRSAAIQEQFATEVPGMEDKNTKNLIPVNMAAPITRSLETRTAASYLQKAFERVASGEIDVNTALREAAEEANQKIAELTN